MKMVLKKVSAVVLAMAVTLTAVVFDVPEKIAAEGEASPAGGCDGSHSGMTGIDDASELTASGKYYLTDDLTLGSEITIGSGIDVTLCLNGYTIDAQEKSRIFNIDGGTLTLCDCIGGKLTGGTADNGGAVYVDSNGTFNMHGGTISGNTAKGSSTRSGCGGGVYAAEGAAFTMSGGNIGGETETDANLAKNGGGVYVAEGATFTMSGSSKISGNIAANDRTTVNGYGGGVYSAGTLEMSGDSEISGSKAEYGSGVFVAGTVGLFTMEGNSKILHNTESKQGGGVFVNAGAEFKMSGNTVISANESGAGSGVMVSSNAKFTMEGNSEISDNTASSTGCVYVHNGCLFTMNGGKISHNTTGKQGGGVFVSGGGLFTMNDGEISDNTADSYGGGVFVHNKDSNGMFTMTGGRILGNTTSSDGGGVDLWGTFTMSGGTISGNTAAGSGSGVDFYQGIFTISGKVEISNNTKNNTANNVYLYGGNTVTIGSGFDTDSEIGVHVSGTITDCLSSVDVAAFDNDVTAADISTSFKADTDGQNIVYENDKVQLIGAHSYGNEWFNDDNFHWNKCIECGAHESNIDHDWEIDEVLQSPDCTEVGSGKYVCSDCGREKTDEIPIDADAHRWGDWTMILESTKTDKGTIQRKCDIDPEHTETEEIPELTDEEFWTLTESKKPSCMENGYEIYECEYGTVKVTLPAPGHQSETDERAEPTCVDTGLTEGSHCQVCGEVLTEQEEIAALGHDWGEGEITKAPTCTENGAMTFTCSRCKETKVDDIETDGHKEKIDEAVPATCTEKGKTAGSHCEVCGEVLTEQEDIAALGHDWDEGEITKAPTCTENGTMTFTCSRCHETKVDDIEADGHKEEIDEAVPATCTEKGKTAGSHCSVCGTVIVEQTDIEALGHSWDEGEITKQPTADETGEKTFTCTVCGATKAEIIPATGGTENPDPDNPDDPDPDSGNISKEVQSGENAPDTKLETPLDELVDAVLTPEEKELVEEGVEIKIVLTVEDGMNSVSAEDKEKVEAVISGLSGCTLGQYLDVHLLKIIGDSQEEITETNALITIVFEIPEALRSEGRTYSVIRVHEGETAVLSDLDSEINTLTIKTDKFSTYALVYSEKSDDTPPAESSSDGSDPTPPVESGSDGNEPTPPVESSSDGNNPTPPAESSYDSSVSTPAEIGSDSSETIPPAENSSESGNPAPSESKPAESGNTPSYVSGEATGSVSASPSEENPSTDEGNTDTNGSSSSSGVSSSDSNGGVAGESEGNPSTGIVAVSFVPLATAIAVLAVTAKRKKR